MYKYIFILIFLFIGIPVSYGASISAAPSSIDFSSLSSSDTPVMCSTPINITWDSTGLTSWMIRIWTDNKGEGGTTPNPLYTGTGDPAGMVGITYPDQTVSLKVWCGNYGPGATPPNVNQSTNWTNYWFYIPDWSTMGTSTGRKLMDEKTALSNPFSIYLAALFGSSVRAQSYKTSTLTVEMINQ